MFHFTIYSYQIENAEEIYQLPGIRDEFLVAQTKAALQSDSSNLKGPIMRAYSGNISTIREEPKTSSWAYRSLSNIQRGARFCR
jgi:hypothetical protein